MEGTGPMSESTIGGALAERRRQLKLEKGRAAQMIGMSRTTYSSYEQDAQRPSVEVFPALADFLQISVEDLLPLYGATCVVAARTALDALTVSRVDDVAPATPEVDSPEAIPPSPIPRGLKSLIPESPTVDADASSVQERATVEQPPLHAESKEVAQVRSDVAGPKSDIIEKSPDKKKKKKKNKKK